MEFPVPKIRSDLEIIPAYSQGRRVAVVKDFLGLIKEPLVLTGEILDFLGLIDGKRNIRDIQLELVRQKEGVFVSSEEIERLLAGLDDTFLLDSEHYRRQKNKIIAEYSLLQVRSASHSGHSYPDSAEELKKYLDSFFCHEESSISILEGKKIGALISPHIDLEIGKKIYAKAFQTLKKASPEKIILLGTGHALHDTFFSITEKDFETPLGRVKTDKDSVKKLIRAGREIVSSNDLAHRREHSLEFQLIFLQYLFGSDFLLVPILCGFFHKELIQVSRPKDIPEVDNFLKALRLLLENYGTQTLVIAGVDFSHIGPKFGHSERASSLLFQSEKHDKLLIKALCEGNVEAFWAESKRVQDKYNVCGFSTLACLLEIIPQARGHLLGYEIWREDATQSAVSFAAVAFEAKKFLSGDQR